MPLHSRLFAGDDKLEACLVNNAAHLVIGAGRSRVEGCRRSFWSTVFRSTAELQAKLYGKSTAAAVLAYKKKRRIINPAYQNTEDNIVGKMTIESLDSDVVIVERKISDFPLRPQDKNFV